MVTCAECGKKINENEAVCDNVIIRVYQRGVFYTVSYGAKMFCSVECRDKWNNRMNALVKRLRKRFLIFLAFVMSMPIIIFSNIPMDYPPDFEKIRHITVLLYD